MTEAAAFASAHGSSKRRTVPAPLELNWYDVCRTRSELDRRWNGNAYVDAVSEDKENARAWEPAVRRLEGHKDRCVSCEFCVVLSLTWPDSVYCAEFDSARIVTGSRDRSIKIWCLKTGECLATIRGHRGSVLCLKFEKDWDLDPNNALVENGLTDWRKGFMVSGSSDHTVCVWDLYACTSENEQRQIETAVTAELRGVLKGHTGGVLDLEINTNWIVSW